MFTREIPQATGYKTIKEVAPDYGYLDDVFAQLFRQDPLERLYPEEKIISEIKILAERNQREKEKEEYTKEILDKPLETFGTDTSDLEEKYGE